MASAFTAKRRFVKRKPSPCGVDMTTLTIHHTCPRCSAAARKLYQAGMTWDEIVAEAYRDAEDFDDPWL